eukprot:NODE_3866_length_515_cov_82.424893_g3296_i0.p1 GENE.NODE_3866_length_515_cov_82.424893_g3296_i0~~NODE_3866_length_515_cov_82.424893_g3296_i0.p1  ORF type:complete len:161 (-),score=41.67 NODE_3866_length_515_cov_82.424893_g3296_i0:33-458(-)
MSGPGLSKQEKTVLAVRENIDIEYYVKERGLGNWFKEVVRGVGRHPWPKYFELTDFFGDKRHGDVIPRNFAALRKLPSTQIVPIAVISAIMGTEIYMWYWRTHTSFWSDKVHEKYGFRSVYSKDFKAQFDGVNKPKLNKIY